MCVAAYSQTADRSLADALRICVHPCGYLVVLGALLFQRKSSIVANETEASDVLGLELIFKLQQQ